jgi:hypothetical protein
MKSSTPRPPNPSPPKSPLPVKTINIAGDYIAGDKVGRDKILGNKTETHFPNATEVKIFESVENYHENPTSTQDPPS